MGVPEGVFTGEGGMDSFLGGLGDKISCLLEGTGEAF